MSNKSAILMLFIVLSFMIGYIFRVAQDENNNSSFKQKTSNFSYSSFEDKEGDLNDLTTCIDELQVSISNAIDELEAIYGLDVEYGDYIPYSELEGYLDDAYGFLDNPSSYCP